MCWALWREFWSADSAHHWSSVVLCLSYSEYWPLLWKAKIGVSGTESKKTDQLPPFGGSMDSGILLIQGRFLFFYFSCLFRDGSQRTLLASQDVCVKSRKA